jgi:hypothetical protein
MKSRSALLAATVGMLATSLPLLAHRSFAVEFDPSNPIKVSGPHAHFSIDVKNDAANVTNWDFELASPDVLLMQSWSRNPLEAGDDDHRRRFLGPGLRPDGQWAQRLSRPMVEKVFAGSTAEREPTKNRTIII